MSSQSPINIGEQPLAVQLPPRPSFARRIQRAHDLSAHYPSGAEMLRFYAQLAFQQEHLFDNLRTAGNAGDRLSSSQQWLLRLDLLLPHFSGFATLVAEISPLPMSSRAAELAATNRSVQSEVLAAFWQNRFRPDEPSSAVDRCIALHFLQPYAEWLAGLRQDEPSDYSGSMCPICGSKPVCAVLRDRAHGASRSLVCSLCMQEWGFQRAICPVCGESGFESLAIFANDRIPHIRIDACDSCRHYIKTIDMTKDGLAVPVVDDLASVALDVWAADRQYRKSVPNVLGL